MKFRLLLTGVQTSDGQFKSFFSEYWRTYSRIVMTRGVTCCASYDFEADDLSSAQLLAYAEIVKIDRRAMEQRNERNMPIPGIATGELFRLDENLVVLDLNLIYDQQETRLKEQAAAARKATRQERKKKLYEQLKKEFESSDAFIPPRFIAADYVWLEYALRNRVNAATIKSVFANPVYVEQAMREIPNKIEFMGYFLPMFDEKTLAKYMADDDKIFKYVFTYRSTTPIFAETCANILKAGVNQRLVKKIRRLTQDEQFLPEAIERRRASDYCPACININYNPKEPLILFTDQEGRSYKACVHCNHFFYDGPGSLPGKPNFGVNGGICHGVWLDQIMKLGNKSLAKIRLNEPMNLVAASEHIVASTERMDFFLPLLTKYNLHHEMEKRIQVLRWAYKNADKQATARAACLDILQGPTGQPIGRSLLELINAEALDANGQRPSWIPVTQTYVR